MILLIDNYDSFTHNIVQTIKSLDSTIEIDVRRNDAVTLDEVDRLSPSHVIISPGPGTPADTGISITVIQRWAGKVPLLGICLGHQAIAAAFGGQVIQSPKLMHGKTSEIEHDGEGVFHGIASPMTATRYHSLIVDESTLPAEFDISARTTDLGEIMGIRHKSLPIEGVQFHPESFLTDDGPALLRNFLKMTSTFTPTHC